MSHYFTYDKDQKQRSYHFDYQHHQHHMIFSSQSGVFSKKKVDFGTHQLLKTIDACLYTSILDLGCGIGIVGISLAKANPKANITSIDVNPLAVALTKQNAASNKVNHITVFESEGYDSIDNTFDLIVCNPPIRAGKKVVHDLVLGGASYLNRGGVIRVVIQKKQGALSLKTKMKDIYGNVTTVAKEKGYFVFESKKETV